MSCEHADLAPGGGASMVKNFLIVAVDFCGIAQFTVYHARIFTRVCFRRFKTVLTATL